MTAVGSFIDSACFAVLNVFRSAQSNIINRVKLQYNVALSADEASG